MHWRQAPVVSLLASLMFVACGGGDTVSADEFVGDVCGATRDWIDGVQEEAAALVTASDPGTSPEEGKEVLVGFSDGLIAETDQLIAAIEGAGVPDVPNGEATVERVTDGINAFKTTLEDFRQEIRDLPTDDPEAFSRESQEISSRFESQFNRIGETLEALESPELDRAAENNATCQEISS
jgi:hypothetical protein